MPLKLFVIFLSTLSIFASSSSSSPSRPKRYVDSSTTTTDSPSSSISTSTKKSGGIEWTILWISIGIVSLCIIILVAFGIYACYKKFFSGKNTKSKPKPNSKEPGPSKERQQEAAVAKPKEKPQKSITIEQNESKTKELKVVKSKQQQPSNKTDSKTTQVSTIAASAVAVAPSVSKEPVKEVVVVDVAEQNKALIEPHCFSLLRNGCLGEHGLVISERMYERYPLLQRDDYEREIKLLSSPIDEMFKKIKKLCSEAENELKRYRVQFDHEKKIEWMGDDAEEYLLNSKTPETDAYFCFGAEFYEFINPDVTSLSKYSIPLLFVIAMQPRFPETNRKEACKWILRHASSVRKLWTPTEREFMPFPVNLIEWSYQMNPQNFDDLSALKTISDVKPSQPSKEVIPKEASKEVLTKQPPPPKTTVRVVVDQKEEKPKSKKKSTKPNKK